MDRDIRAKLGQPLRHHAPEPAARAGDKCDLASEFFGHAIRLHILCAKVDRAHVVGAAADHGQFVIRDPRIVAVLPGGAKVRVVGEAIDPRGGEAGGKRGADSGA